MRWASIIESIMDESYEKGGITSRNQLRQAMGWSSPAGIYHILRSPTVTLQKFRQMMDLMGYEILLIPRDPKRTAFKIEKDI